MKIVCDSCGAKYQIADDKVAPGKVFKIRCKKCSSVIVVRGDQEPEEQDEATRVFDYGGEAVWHVVVDGEQQGPFAPLQLGGLLSDGKIDPDTYVWKDGFDGWKAMREVPELASVIGTLGADAPVESADLFATADAGEADAGDADLFGSASSSPFAGGGGAKESKAASKGAGLFASGGGLDDDEVVASRPSPRVSADEANLTGQRNENSVLFSLSNLQALATGPAPAAASSSKASSSSSSAGSFSAPAAAAPKQSAGFASGEASGLIDIRALASSAAAPRSAPAKSSSVDDLLSIGAGSSALSAGALAAPALAPIVREPEPAPSGGSNKGLLIGGGIVMIAAVAAAVFFAMKPPEVVTEVREVQVGGAPTTGAAPTDPSGAAPAAGTEAAPATGTTAAPAAPAAPAVPARPLTPAEQAREDARQREREAARALAAANMTTTPATPATPAAPATMTAAASGDINSLVNMALGAPVAMETEAANPNLPETPARDAVASALRGVSAQVRACGAGEHGSAPVSVVFRSSGAVSNATVGGQFAGTPVGSCVARAVRGARVPPFRNASFSVTFPYAL